MSKWGRPHSLKRVRTRLYRQQSGRCYYCRCRMFPRRDNIDHPDDLTIDHRIPPSLGGSKGGLEDTANLVAACRTCNEAKAAQTEEEFKAYLKERS